MVKNAGTCSFLCSLTSGSVVPSSMPSVSLALHDNIPLSLQPLASSPHPFASVALWTSSLEEIVAIQTSSPHPACLIISGFHYSI